jgi:hypothetical protein
MGADIELKRLAVIVGAARDVFAATAGQFDRQGTRIGQAASAVQELNVTVLIGRSD